MKISLFALIVLGLCLPTFASSPRTSVHTSKSDFGRGTAKNITITHDGFLKPGPVKTKIADSGQPVIWDMVVDSRGSFYLATGNEGKLYRTSTAGDTSVVFDADELGIFSLAVDPADNVYAATSPNGAVYKIDRTGNSTLFFDPEARYIWDLVWEPKNNLLVATGDSALIYRITPKGQSSVVYEGEEGHVRTLALAQDGTLYAGTSGKGYVYRIENNKAPFVVFDPQMQEVHGLIEHTDGYLYAAVYGESVIPMLTRTQQDQRESNQSDEDEDNGGGNDDESALAAQTIRAEGIVRLRGGSTSLFRISPEGYAKDLWVGSDEKIQSIFPYSETELIIGSGKSGNLLKINQKGDLSILLENEESHVTSFINYQNKLYFSTANLGRLYALEAALSDSAVYESETIDAGLTADWGTLLWEGEQRAGLKFFTRSGNTEQPLNTWSAWEPVKKDGEVYRITSPMARFIQWKCEFQNKNATVNKVTINYMQKNLAPQITSIVVHSSGDYYEANSKNDNKEGISFPSPVSNKKTQKGYRSVDWIFEDPNFDRIKFDVFYRRTGQSFWRELAKDLSTNIYSWDTEQMADGEYEIKIVAKDSPSNPETKAEQSSDVSKPFIIDNTGPQIEQINVGNNENKKMLTFRITDEWNTLDNVEYSINAGSWKLLYPVDGILDSQVENFEIELSDSEAQDVAIKAADSIDNVTVVHTQVN